MRKKKTSVQVCCATCLDRFLPQPWTDFDSTFFTFLTPVFLSQNLLKPLFYRVFSKNNNFVAHPKKLGTLFVNTTALTDLLVLFFCIFGSLVFCCVHFLGVFFWKEWKTKDWTQNNPKINKTTRCKPDNHLVLFTKKESRQHRHKTMQLHCLDYKETTQETKKQDQKH